MTVEINKIYCGDCLTVMPVWGKEIADCCVTSPPYWGLRDYGLPPTKWPDGSECCYGLEPTPELYVAHTVLIFAEVWRVLKPEGTLWLNLGDSYWGGGNNSPISGKQASNAGAVGQCADHQKNTGKHDVIKTKDLCGIPWRVAFALQAAGWYLRQDIIWHKPNPMPESVRDRCTKAHEYVFLMSKSKKYYYDIDAIRVPQVESNDARPRMGQGPNTQYNQKRSSWHDHKDDLQVGNRIGPKEDHPKGKNKRDVWTVPLAPFPEAHFATFPPALIEPCILAGCPEGGLVLDPFMGSGTTAMVAYENRRNYIGCELNPEYIKLNRADKAKEKYGLFEKSKS